MLQRLPESYAATTDALHRLAVYVISPAQRLVNGEIVLRATPGGFGTFEFGDADRVVRVDEGELVVDEAARELRRGPIRSLAEAAGFLGITADLAQEQQFDVPPAGDVDAPMPVDPAAVRGLHAWYAFAQDVLEALRAEAAQADDVSPVRIWPEHFDSAIDMGSKDAGRRATYGASPRDRHHAEPYLYVSPWAGRIDPFFDDPGFRGAALPYADLLAAADQRAAALRFLRRARRAIDEAAG
jgi:hypothetical protein